MENTNNNHGIPGFSDDSSIDFKRYLSLFISNWYWFAFGLFLSLTIAYGINRYSERIFTVSSSLLIKDDQFGGEASQLGNIFPGGQVFKIQQNLKNEIGILKSFNLNRRVIDSLPLFHIEYLRIGRRNIVERRLYNDSPFQVISDDVSAQPQGKVLLRITPDDSCIVEIQGRKGDSDAVALGQHYNKYGYSFRIFSRNPENGLYQKDLSNKYAFQFQNPSAVANGYRSKLSITPISEAASLVILTVSGYVAEQEAAYLNKLMELYIVQGMELKNQTADSTIAFIDVQLDTILKKLNDAEDELEEFRKNNQLIDLSSEGAYLQKELESFGNEMALLNLQQSYFDYLKLYLDPKSPVTDLISPSVMGVGDQLLIGLVQDLTRLQQQRNLLKMNLSELSVPIVTLEFDLMRTKEALKDNIEGGEIRIANSITSLKRRIRSLEEEIEKLPSTEKDLISIQRKFEINNTVYTYLLEKQAETSIARASSVSDNRVIDNSNSFNSSQIRPRESRNNLMAFIFGLLLPAIVLLLIDALNNKIIDKTDVEKRTDFPIIGYISHNDNKSEIPVQEKPASTLAESFRLIRTNLKYFVKDTKSPVIAISSTISAEGKTFISINMATIFAMLGKKVLLVGLDLRKPRIHKVLEVENGKGLSTYLSGENEFQDIVQKTRIDNLFYAPSGPVPPNPAELIASERMKQFIDEAREKYDIIIIDTPPIAIVTDALLISSMVDMYLLVVRQRYTSKSTLDLIQEMYKNKTIRNAGIVINDISRSGYYGYGIRYGYYSGYGYSYGYSYYNTGYATSSRGRRKNGNDYYLE